MPFSFGVELWRDGTSYCNLNTMTTVALLSLVHVEMLDVNDIISSRSENALLGSKAHTLGNQNND
jgi:hypothetical protein